MPAALVGDRLPQPPPLRRLHRPRRHRRAADRDRRLLELPDQPRRRAAAGRERRGRRPHGHLRAADRRRRRARSFSFGAVLAGRAGRRASSRSCARAAATSARPGRRAGTIASFFDGEATSEVGLKAGPRQRLLDRRCSRTSPRSSGGCGRPTRASAPASAARRARRPVRALAALMRAAAANPSLRPARSAQIAALQAATAERIARSYLADGSAATFRVIVDPLVTWMWIGGLIALAGAADRDLAVARPSPRRRSSAPRPRRSRKPSTARSATPSSTTPPASSPTRTSPLLDAELRGEAVEILDRSSNGDGTAAAPPASRNARAAARLPRPCTRSQRHPGHPRRRPDLPHPAALGERRGPLRRLRHRRRRQLLGGGSMVERNRNAGVFARVQDAQEDQSPRR